MIPSTASESVDYISVVYRSGTLYTGCERMRFTEKEVPDGNPMKGMEMPTYEYLCEACGHRFEKFQQMIDEPLKECPRCGQHLKRLIGSGSGVIFKGSGFYATDYKSSSTRCGKESTCCGRETPCERRPCDD